MQAKKRDDLLWSKEELLQKYREAPEEDIRRWALNWLFLLFAKEKDAQAVFREELSRLKTDNDLSRFFYARSFFVLLSRRENAAENGPFLLEKVREYYERKGESRELFLWSLRALSLSGYLPGLALLKEILGDLFRAYRRHLLLAEDKADAEAEQLLEDKKELLRQIADIVFAAAPYALREPQAYKEAFAALLSEVDDDDILWLHVAGGAIKGGDYTLVHPFAWRYLSIPAEQRAALELQLFLGELLDAGFVLRIFGEDENADNDFEGLKNEIRDRELLQIYRFSRLLKLYPELAALLGELNVSKREVRDGRYYRRLNYLTARRLDKEELLDDILSVRRRKEKAVSFLEKAKYCRLLFLKAFGELAAAQTDQEPLGEEEAGKKAALQKLLHMEAYILLYNAIFLLNISSLHKERPNLSRRQFWERALGFLRLSLQGVEADAFWEELLPLLEARDIAFFARTAAAVRSLGYLDESKRRFQRRDFRPKRHMQRGSRGSRALRSWKESGYVNYLRKKTLLEPLRESKTISLKIASRVNTLITKQEVFEQCRNCIAVLEEYAGRSPKSLLIHLPLLFEIFHSGFFEEYIQSIIGEMGVKAFPRLKQMFTSLSREKKKSLLGLFSLLPLVRTRELFLHNWDYFYSLDPGEVYNVAESLADPAFLPFLVQEWKAGGREAAGIILFICNLHNPKDLPRELPEIQRYHRQALQLEKKIAAILASDSPAEEKMRSIQRLKPYVELTFRCRICGKVQRQRFEALNIVEDFYDIKKDDLQALQQTAFPNEFVTCMRCGAVNNYAYTPETKREILEELEQFEEIVSQRKADEEYDVSFYPRLRFIALEWRDDGGKALSPLEALDYFSRKIEENPQEAGYYVGLAEVFSFFKRYEQADQ